MAGWLKKLLEGGLDSATRQAIKQSDAAVDRIPQQATKELTVAPRPKGEGMNRAPREAAVAEDTRSPLEMTLDGLEGRKPVQASPAAPDAPPRAPRTPKKIDEQPTPVDPTAKAAQLRGARLEAFDLEATHQPNFNVIETEDDIKAVIAQMAESDSAGIEAARTRSVASDEDLMALADDMNTNPDEVVAFIKNSEQMPTEGEIVAARKFLHSSAAKLKQLAEKVDSGQATDIEKIDFMRQVQLHGEFNRVFMAKRAEAGRRLRVYGLPIGAEPEQLKQMSELMMTMQGKDIDRIASAIKNAETPQQISGIANAKRTRMQKFGDLVKFLYINSILSGPKTHLVNTLGNTLFQAMNIVELSMAARLGRFLNLEEKIVLGEATARTYGLVTSWRDALRLAKKGFMTGESAIDQFHKVELPMERPLSAEWMGVNEDSILGKSLDGLHAILGAPTERFLTAEDDFFKAMTYRGVIAQHAHRIAQRAQAAGKVDAQGAADLVANLMANPTEQMLKAAREEQLELTFQNPLGKTGQQMQSVINSYTPLKLIAPFIRTPVNIFKQAGRRSPLALAMPSFYQAMKAGGVEQQMALTRLAMGTATTAVIAAAVSDGTVTGGGPSNWKARQLLETTGWQPYSIRVVNPITGKITYQSYARAEPLAYVIGATADAAELAAYAEWNDPRDPDQEQFMTMIALIVGAVAENTMSKTFLSGLSDMAMVFSEPERYVEGWTSRMVGAFVPYSAFLRDMTKIDDPVMRQALTMQDKLKKQIPGYSEELPDRTDLWGDPILHPTGEILGVFSPYPSRKDKGISHRQEIADLMVETKRVPLTMPAKSIAGIRLTAQEYATFLEYSRKIVTIDGMNFEAYIAAQMKSPGFQRLSSDAKVDALRSMQLGFDQAGRERTLAYYEDDDLGQRVRNRQTLEYELKTGVAE